MTEEEELYEVYRLTCVAIPTCKPRIRIDHPTLMFLRRHCTDDDLCWTVDRAVEQQRPVLIGTSSVEESNAVMASLRYWCVHMCMHVSAAWQQAAHSCCRDVRPIQAHMHMLLNLLGRLLSMFANAVLESAWRYSLSPSPESYFCIGFGWPCKYIAASSKMQRGIHSHA